MNAKNTAYDWDGRLQSLTRRGEVRYQVQADVQRIAVSVDREPHSKVAGAFAHAKRHMSQVWLLLLRGVRPALGVAMVFTLSTGNAHAEGESGSQSAASPTKLSLALSAGVQGGIAYFTENTPFGTDSNIGQGLAPGYNLGLRASFEFFSWLAFDARGLLLRNDGNPLVQFGSTTTSGGLGAVRFTAPLPHIHPYALVGFGGYHLGASSGGPTSKETLLLDDTVWAIESGLGAVVPTGYGVEVGVEWLYSHLHNETLATAPTANGGDPSTLSVFVQYRLPL
jgi:hypothetical protein